MKKGLLHIVRWLDRKVALMIDRILFGRNWSEFDNSF